MVAIRYNENPHVFDLLFNIQDYIPAKYFDGDEKNVELLYYKDLFLKNNMLNPKEEGIPMIWSTHYSCTYGRLFNKIRFTMVYDEDYGIVSFAVNHPKHRVKIAEKIRSLVEKEKLLHDRHF